MGLAWEEKNYRCDGQFLKFGWLNEKVGFFFIIQVQTIYVAYSMSNGLKIFWRCLLAFSFYVSSYYTNSASFLGGCAISAK